MSSVLLGDIFNFYVGFAAASALWLALDFLCHVLVATIVVWKNAAFDDPQIKSRAALFRQHLSDAVIQPIFFLFSYVTSFAIILIQNWAKVFLVIVACAASVTITLYSPQLVLLIDDTYESIRGPILRGGINGLKFFNIIADILIALVNFGSEMVWGPLKLLFQTANHCTAANGGAYFSSLFEDIGQLAYASEALVLQTISFAEKNTRLDMTGVIQPVQLVAYDLTLRMSCICSAASPLWLIMSTGILGPNDTVLIKLGNAVVNGALDIPRIIIGLFKNIPDYKPPDTDQIFDDWVMAIHMGARLGNQLLMNFVGFLSSLNGQTWQMPPIFDLFLYGTPDLSGKNLVYSPAIPENPVTIYPIPSIPLFALGGVGSFSAGSPVNEDGDVTPAGMINVLKHMSITGIEFFRVIFRVIFNAQTIVNGLAEISTQSQADAYAILDAEGYFQASYNLSHAVFTGVIGHIYPRYTLNFGKTLELVADSFLISYTEFFYEVFRRVIFQYRYTTSGYYTQEGQYCYVEPNTLEPAGWQNFLSTLYRCTGVFEEIVVKRWYAAANQANLAFAPYYSPIGELLYFGMRYWIQVQNSWLQKASYLVYSFIQLKPPSAACISILGRSPRILMDNAIMSLPDFWEFFLDMKQAQDSGNAHLNCQQYLYHNYIYAGAMKVFFYASKTCSAKYPDNTFMQCEFENPADCAQNFELAYSDFSINALCSFDDTLVAAALALLKGIRVRLQAVEVVVVDVLACLIDYTTCLSSVTTTVRDAIGVLSEAMCLVHNIGMHVTGFAGGAIMNPIYEFMYADYDNAIPGNNNALMRADPTLAVVDPTILARYVVSVHRKVGTCFAATSSFNCPSTPEASSTCYWHGNACIYRPSTNTGFLNTQPYILEAATITWMQSIYNGVVFLPLYLGYLQILKYGALLDSVNFQSSNDVVSKLIDGLLVEQEVGTVLDFFRLVTVGVRDFLIATIELVRSFLHITSYGNSDSTFLVYEAALFKYINIFEVIVQVCTQVAIDFIATLMRMFMDLLSIITNPSSAAQSGQDFGKQLTHLFDEIANGLVYIVDAIMQLPILKQLCPIVAAIAYWLNLIFGPGSGISQTCHDIVNTFSAIPVVGFFSFLITCPATFNLNQIQCNLPAGCMALEATTCMTNSDCGYSSYCVIQNVDQCGPNYNPHNCPWSSGSGNDPINIILTNNNEAWAAPCQCGQLVDGQHFCNRATGLCEHGINPFGPPLNQCPSSNNFLVDDDNLYNQQCWIFPAYKYQSHYIAGDMNGFGTAMAQGFMTAMEGPRLCRTYCDPSPFNRKNWLYTDNRQSGQYSGYGCVCMLGSVYYPTGGIDMNSISTFYNFDYTPYYSANLAPLDTSTANGNLEAAPAPQAHAAGSQPGSPSTDGGHGQVSSSSAGNGGGISSDIGGFVSSIASTFDYVFGRRRLLQVQPTVYSDIPYQFWQYNTTYCDHIMLHYALIPRESRSVLEQVHVSDCETRAMVGSKLAARLKLPPRAYRMFTDWVVLFDTLTHAVQSVNITLPPLPSLPPGVMDRTFKNINKLVTIEKPSWSEMTNFTTFLLSTLDKNTTTTRRKIMQHLTGATLYPWADIPGSSELVPSDVYTFVKNVTLSGTCAAVTDFVNGFQKAGNHLVDAFKNNVQGAVCRMYHPISECYDPAQSAAKPASSHPSSSSSSHATGTKSGNALADSVLGSINSVFGIDIVGFANRGVNYLFNTLPNRRKTTASASATTSQITESYFICNFDAVQCTRRRNDRGVITSFFYITAFMVAANYAIAKLFLSPGAKCSRELCKTGPFVFCARLAPFSHYSNSPFRAGYAYGLLCTVIIFPVLFKVHYDVNFSCNAFFFGAVPVCFADDVVTQLDRWTPQHLPWPTTLISTAERMSNGLLPEGSVIDCSKDPYGFLTGERSLFYILERFAPTWRHYISGLSVGAIIGSKASAEMQYYYKKPVHEEPYPTCFYLTSVNFIPVLVILVLVVVFLFAAIQLIILVTTNLSRAIDDAIVILALIYAESVLLVERKKEL